MLLLVLLGGAAAGGWAWWWTCPGRPADAIVQGRAALDRGDWDDAARLARLRLKAAPQDPEALRLLARTSYHQGRNDLALALFDRLGDGSLQPDDRYFLGLALARIGKTQSAIRVWEGDGKTGDPTRTPATLVELIRAYFRRDELDRAASTAEALLRRAGWESQALALLGMISLELNDPGRAADYWLHSLQSRSSSGDASLHLEVPPKDLARALLRVGRVQEATDQLRKVLADGPDPEALWLMGRAHLQRKDWSAARADLEAAREYRDANPMARDPGPYVGSASCAPCHRGEHRTQQASRHSRTFFREADLAKVELPESPIRDPFDAAVVHTLARGKDGLVHQKTRAGSKVFEAVVQYAFGSGDRGLTPVGRDANGRAYELRLSDYPESHGSSSTGRPVARWDVTSGHPRTPSKPEEFLGQPLTEDLVRRCVFCHVTDIKGAVDRTGPCAMDHGIGCERCHGPGGNHLLAVEGKLVDLDAAIARPNHASGEPIVKLCAECHSPRGIKIARDDPAAPRFQGTTLTWSRCYTESQNALDCTTCHDPHRNASTSKPEYEARCLECHSPAGRERASSAAKLTAGRSPPQSPGLRLDARRTVCPVNPSTGCIDCHMPAVSGVVPHSTFTDHFIRVHRD
ncbi:MAG: tetratricopeptide repeat protein [Isosphaeraceae bacterium]